MCITKCEVQTHGGKNYFLRFSLQQTWCPLSNICIVYRFLFDFLVPFNWQSHYQLLFYSVYQRTLLLFFLHFFTLKSKNTYIIWNIYNLLTKMQRFPYSIQLKEDHVRIRFKVFELILVRQNQMQDMVKKINNSKSSSQNNTLFHFPCFLFRLDSRHTKTHCHTKALPLLLSFLSLQASQ